MTKCNRCGKDNPAEVHTCTSLITRYNDVVFNIVEEFTKKLYKEEGEEYEDGMFYIMDFNGVMQGPVEIWDCYLDLDNILVCMANNFTAKSVMDYFDLEYDTNMGGKEIDINYYNYAKYGIKGKQYSEDEIKESEDKVNKVKQEFEDLINN